MIVTFGSANISNYIETYYFTEGKRNEKEREEGGGRDAVRNEALTKHKSNIMNLSKF